MQAIQSLCKELEQYGQYSSLAQNVLTKIHGLQTLFEAYIHATQDNRDSVQIRIGTLWGTIQEYFLYYRQELSRISISDLSFLQAFQLKKILSILSIFSEIDKENREIILRTYEEKYTIFLTPISVHPILCPLWKSRQQVRVFSRVSDEYSHTFLQNRLGIRDFENINVSQDVTQTLIVPTDIGKNDFEQKIAFITKMLAYYSGKLCIVTASKVESQSVFLALLEQKEETS